jgi:hypothetical protein
MTAAKDAAERRVKEKGLKSSSALSAVICVLSSRNLSTLLEMAIGSYRDQLGSVIFPRPSRILFFRLLTLSNM